MNPGLNDIVRAYIAVAEIYEPLPNQYPSFVCFYKSTAASDSQLIYYYYPTDMPTTAADPWDGYGVGYATQIQQQNADENDFQKLLALYNLNPTLSRSFQPISVTEAQYRVAFWAAGNYGLGDPARVIRAYSLPIGSYPENAKGEKLAEGFVCFFSQQYMPFEAVIFYYNTGYTTVGSSSWGFTGISDTPPAGGTLQAQDLSAFQHLMDKNKITYPAGLSLTPIPQATAGGLITRWLELYHIQPVSQ